MEKGNGFTLVELLAVIVILGIILAIAIPGITGIIESSRTSAFTDNVKLLIRGIETKIASDGNYDVTDLSLDTLEEDLNVSSDNYQSVGAYLVDGKVYVNVVGQNKWDGLEGHGTLTSLNMGGDSLYALAPESCFTFDEGTGTIIAYDLANSSCPKSLRIPDTINGISVEHIGQAAFVNPVNQVCFFDDMENAEDKSIDYIHTEGDGYVSCFLHPDEAPYTLPITDVMIPNSVTTIGNSAFLANNLSSVIIGSGVTLIDEYAFAYTSLPSITIPNNVTTIGYGAFAEGQLTSITLPNNLPEITPFLFWDDPLTSINIPNSVTAIGKSAFSNNQLTNVTISNNATSIGEGAFEDNQLASVSIPGSVTTIDINAFRENQLTNLVLANGITSIGEDSFADNQLTSLSIPSSVTLIDVEAFYGNQIANLTLVNGIETIDEYAFGGNQLTSVVIPNSVTTIGDGAFYKSDGYSNPNLTNITNLTGNSFNWGLIINNITGFNFVTGTVTNSAGNVVVAAS